MPYKRKEDKAAQMRRRRVRKKQEFMDFERELRKINSDVAKRFRGLYPGLFPSQRKPRKKKVKGRKKR